VEVMKKGQKKSGATRRDFAKTVALMAAAPLTAPAGTAQAQKPDAASGEAADALIELVKARHGKHLTEEQLKAMRPSIARAQAAAARLRKVKLSNGDEPAFLFQADVP
jgi:hypothetical protein